jgi:hypothetical protein
MVLRAIGPVYPNPAPPDGGAATLLAMALPTAPVAAGSLVAGYLVARETGIRPLGGAVLAAGGAWCGREWLRAAGPVAAGALGVGYLAAFGLSHPLAKRIGAWPSVLAVSGATAAAAWLVADRRGL